MSAGLLSHRPVEAGVSVGRCALGCGAVAGYIVSASDGGHISTTATCGPCLRRGEARALRMLADLIEEPVPA